MNLAAVAPTTRDAGTQFNHDTMAYQLPTRTLPQATDSQPVFRLLDLPSELRLKIFNCFFESRRILVRCQDSDCNINHSTGEEFEDDYDGSESWMGIVPITCVSKLIRVESMSCFLRTVTFDFQLLDYHLDWTPSGTLLSCIKRMKNLYGPPRMLHFLGLTTLRWSNGEEQGPKWLEDCAAEHIVCDMILDQFDIEDALGKPGSNEALYWEGVRGAIRGNKGSRLTLCVMVEDEDPVWDGTGGAPARSGIQVWKQKVIVRRRPYTEEGKTKLKGLLKLLGLELQERDKKILEPKKNEPVPGVVSGTPIAVPTITSLSTATAVAAASNTTIDDQGLAAVALSTGSSTNSHNGDADTQDNDPHNAMAAQQVFDTSVPNGINTESAGDAALGTATSSDPGDQYFTQSLDSDESVSFPASVDDLDSAQQWWNGDELYMDV